jgi:NAD(P)-dependent dehydrogenase (short-subunit alcohol dehydrogenase family)
MMIAETRKLAGKVAIITGGGTGMGKATALLLAKNGADVVVAARRIEPLEQTAQEIRGLGSKSLAIPTDIMDSSQVNAMVAKAIAEFGKIDILINNSGIVRGGPRTRVIWETSDEEWHLHMDTNLTGAFFCCRAVVKHMVEQQSGKIVNIASEAGARGAIDWYMYPAAKAGVVEMTRSLALTYARYNIQANCINPGMIDTHEYQPAPPPNMAAGPATRYDPNHFDPIPIGHFGHPMDIAHMVLFLVAEASDYVTGGLFNVDGGRLAGGFGPAVYRPMIAMEEV